MATSAILYQQTSFQHVNAKRMRICIFHTEHELNSWLNCLKFLTNKHLIY